MFFVYSLKYNTRDITLHDHCDNADTVQQMLDKTARNFIMYEQGGKKAENPYYDNVLDSDIKEDGYFLRNNEHDNIINVYLRKTNINAGLIGTYVTVTCDKVMHFGILKYGDDNTCFRQRAPETPRVTTPVLQPAMSPKTTPSTTSQLPKKDQHNGFLYMHELKAKIQQQKNN